MNSASVATIIVGVLSFVGLITQGVLTNRQSKKAAADTNVLSTRKVDLDYFTQIQERNEAAIARLSAELAEEREARREAEQTADEERDARRAADRRSETAKERADAAETKVAVLTRTVERIEKRLLDCEAGLHEVGALPPEDT